MSVEESINEIAEILVSELIAAGRSVSTAESCTGGWIATLITDLPRSSQWFDAAVVCYSNAAKSRLLAVPAQTIEEFGAVSGDTVLYMTDGLFEKTGADVAVSVSGIAGPEGGSADKPVGTVWLCWGKRGKTSLAHEYHFEGDREAVRLQTVDAALNAVMDLLGCG